jgi:hypothetical protein
LLKPVAFESGGQDDSGGHDRSRQGSPPHLIYPGNQVEALCPEPFLLGKGWYEAGNNFLYGALSL